MISLSAVPLEHVACNLCGADDASRLFTQKDLLTHYPKPFQIVRCRRCGLVYINPRPCPEDMGRFYPPEFVSYQFESTADPSSVSRRDRLLAWMVQDMARKRVRKLRNTLPLGPGMRVLDVGCGKGNFLAMLAQEVGCTVCGLDFDEASVTYCRDQLGIHALHGDLRVLAGNQDQFDLVTMWHFLEHDHDPLAALRCVRACLEPGGVLFIEVPNVDSLENSLFGRRSYLYDVPRHLYNFSPTTLASLLGKAGFVVEKVVGTPGSGGWLGSFQQVLTGGKIYRDLLGHLGSLFALAVLLLPLDALVCLTDKGSIMDVVARKARA